MIVQPAHFFDRLPAKEGAAAGVRRAYIFQRDSDGHIFFSDTAIVAGATRVYLHDRVGYAGRTSFDTEGEGARTATLFGGDVVQL